jgi:hypothetical protein
MPEGCEEVLAVGAWQNMTTPEDMIKAVDAEEEGDGDSWSNILK